MRLGLTREGLCAQRRTEAFFTLGAGNGEEKGDFMRVKCLLALGQPKQHRPHSGQCSGVLGTMVAQSCLGNRWLSPPALASVPLSAAQKPSVASC